MNKTLEALRELVILAGMSDKEVYQYEQKGIDYNEQVEINESIIKREFNEKEAYEKKVKRYLELVRKHLTVAPYQEIKSLEELDVYIIEGEIK
jgi:glutamate synthase domain-containing protein 3